MTFSITATSNASAVSAQTQAKETLVKQAITSSLDQSTRQGVSMARKLVRKKTGALSGSIGSGSLGSYGRWIGFGKKYGIYIEKGRRGFCARNAKALRFTVGGKVVFRKCVGPAKAYPFMEPTATYLNTYFPRVLEQKVSAALK